MAMPVVELLYEDFKMTDIKDHPRTRGRESSDGEEKDQSCFERRIINELKTYEGDLSTSDETGDSSTRNNVVKQKEKCKIKNDLGIAQFTPDVTNESMYMKPSERPVYCTVLNHG